MRAHPVIDQALNLQTSLQPGSRLGIEALASAVGATPSPESGILRYHSGSLTTTSCSSRANGFEGMLDVEPDDPVLALRAFDLDRHFETFPPHFTEPIARRQSSLRQILTG